MLFKIVTSCLFALFTGILINKTGVSETQYDLDSSTSPVVMDVFGHLPFPVDVSCTSDKSLWWYRTYDGSCNWPKANETGLGQANSTKPRDFDQYFYNDGLAEPRNGPNARAVSNAFFRRKRHIYYEHTPFMVGLIEFIMHDVTFSQTVTEETIEVIMPPDETELPLDTTFQVSRTAAKNRIDSSGMKRRDLLNGATAWLDASALYGSSQQVAAGLRSFTKGHMRVLSHRSPGSNTSQDYLPWESDSPSFSVGHPHMKPSKLFAGGDPRTNEDWLLLAVHTLFLREHNRLCDALAQIYPDLDDEQLYQTAKLVVAAKLQLIGNSYQMAYFTNSMPWPHNDGFPLFRQMFGGNLWTMNPAITYPWPLFTKNGRPMTISAEMAVGYRFHEFLMKSFPIKNEDNVTLRRQSLFSTGYDAEGFLATGLDNILRGMVAESIPNFKSGIDEDFRSAVRYKGAPFDLAAWGVIREREQGLPTFNNYFRAWNAQDPKVVVPVRERFEDFSTDMETVLSLKRLYNTTDDVDLVVGLHLDEEMFPGTTIPKSTLIISLFSLFGTANSDRFCVGFALMRCLLVDKPWNYLPSNALEDLIWKPHPLPGFPNARWIDPFWIKELDLQAYGTNLLWRLVSENTDIQCLQLNPLFPPDQVSNPVQCTLLTHGVGVADSIRSIIQIISAVFLSNAALMTLISALILVYLIYLILYRTRGSRTKSIPVAAGWPLLGVAVAYQRDPKSLLLRSFANFHGHSHVFGLKLGRSTHYVLTQLKDLRLLQRDVDDESKFSHKAFMKSINFSIIIKERNFESDIQALLVRSHLTDFKTLRHLSASIDRSSKMFLEKFPLDPRNENGLNSYLNQYIAYVMSYTVVGSQGFDDPQLLATFLKFNDDAISGIGLSLMLPSFLRTLAARPIEKNYSTIRGFLLPIIRRMRSGKSRDPSCFLPFILDATNDDSQASDLVAIIVWGGIVNLQITLLSTILDIINEPHLQDVIFDSLKGSDLDNLFLLHNRSVNDQCVIGADKPWARLRSAMLESIRLCSPISGPARLIMRNTPLPSDPGYALPKGGVATMSAFWTHRDSSIWGSNAALYEAERFVTENGEALMPPIGEAGLNAFLSWGLQGQHMCPGRHFAQAVIQILSKNIIEKYSFFPSSMLSEDDKYVYQAGSVFRTQVEIHARRR